MRCNDIYEKIFDRKMKRFIFQKLFNFEEDLKMKRLNKKEINFSILEEDLKILNHRRELFLEDLKYNFFLDFKTSIFLHTIYKNSPISTGFSKFKEDIKKLIDNLYFECLEKAKTGNLEND